MDRRGRSESAASHPASGARRAVAGVLLAVILAACADSAASVVPTSTLAMPTAVASMAAAAPSRPPGGSSPQARNPLAQVPVCPDLATPLFTTIPMRLEDFRAFRPLGFVSPPIHVFPAKHSSFALALPGEPPPRRPVYLPGDVWVIEITWTEYVGLNKTGYGLTFYPCRELKAYFGHLSSLSDRLLQEAKTGDVRCNPPYQTGGTTVKGCRSVVSLRAGAGEVAGFSGDAAGVDFGAVDYRIPPLGFAEPAHYMREMLHYVSPVGYFTPEARALFETRLASYDGAVRRTAEPIAGAYMQDLPGTAQGNWFPPDVNLSIPFQQPDAFLALVHDYVSPTQPVFSVGNAVKGLPAGIYSFTPEPEGKVNRDFSQVTADGTVYCYDRFLSGRTVGGLNLGNPRGIILLSMPTAVTLRIEKRGSAGTTCSGTVPWAFSPDAATFER
ncbi:MAG: hypothetical protein HY331_17385 [Chloroflexi bacterium]|nr:hypothetical protein [Chloroflexota bacterium]